MFLSQKFFFGILNTAVPQEVAPVLVVNKVKVLVTFQWIHWQDSNFTFTDLLDLSQSTDKHHKHFGKEFSH